MGLHYNFKIVLRENQLKITLKSLLNFYKNVLKMPLNKSTQKNFLAFLQRCSSCFCSLAFVVNTSFL